MYCTGVRTVGIVSLQRDSRKQFGVCGCSQPRQIWLHELVWTPLSLARLESHERAAAEY
jgi:hypothetical protein